MRKLLLLLICILMFSDIVYANQYVYVKDGYTFNKDQVLYVRKKGKTITFKGHGDCSYAYIDYSTTQEADQDYKRIIKEFNKKDK